MMEYLDILDENGESTGKTASRDEAHQKGLWHKSVHVWIINSNSNNEILIRNALITVKAIQAFGVFRAEVILKPAATRWTALFVKLKKSLV